MRNGGSEATGAAGIVFRQCGVTDKTAVTVLKDGDAGLRAIHQQVAPQSKHVLDWFHVAMKFTNLLQLAKGVNVLTDGPTRDHALEQLERGKWRFWHGYTKRRIIGLVELKQWAEGKCFEHIPSLAKLARALCDMIRYLD